MIEKKGRELSSPVDKSARPRSRQSAGGPPASDSLINGLRSRGEPKEPGLVLSAAFSTPRKIASPYISSEADPLIRDGRRKLCAPSGQEEESVEQHSAQKGKTEETLRMLGTNIGKQESESGPKFHERELVWAKVRGHAWWPAIVGEINFQNVRERDLKYIVHFLGDKTRSFLSEKYIRNFSTTFI